MRARRRLAAAERQKEAAIDAQEFERAAMWRDVERRLRQGSAVNWPPPIPGSPRGYRLAAGALAKHVVSALAAAFLFAVGLAIAYAIWG